MGNKETTQYPNYELPQHVSNMLVNQHIIDANEIPQQMLERVVETLFSIEDQSNISLQEIDVMKGKLASYMISGHFMLGTPTLTNAGRNKESALSSCVLIPVNLNDRSKATEIIRSYYRQNMGSGFDLTPYEDPVGLLSWLNDLAVNETATGEYDRYIGNIGSLHVAHPKIYDFVDAKLIKNMRHFNISVDLSENFISAVLSKSKFQLVDGTEIDANELFDKISNNAWKSGEPGVLFLDRMNKDNPVPDIGRYVSTPPCGEMGMTEGETCQFGYINLSRFVLENGIDWKKLQDVTNLATRTLDNAVEYSISRYPNETSTQIALLKRKIGIGVCGLADTLILMGLPYDSQKGRDLARDLLSFINYHSKVQSVLLAREKGSCLAMKDKEGNLYYKGFLENKYSEQATNTITKEMWVNLSNHIKKSGELRNILTTALPPTGRASLILGASPSVEPVFSILDHTGNIHTSILDYLNKCGIKNIDEVVNEAKLKGSFQGINFLPENIKSVLKTAIEISASGHIDMIASLAGINGVIDEAASKTVNLQSSATSEDVKKIYLEAHKKGLKNITIYRDKTKDNQPETL